MYIKYTQGQHLYIKGIHGNPLHEQALCKCAGTCDLSQAYQSLACRGFLVKPSEFSHNEGWRLGGC